MILTVYRVPRLIFFYILRVLAVEPAIDTSNFFYLTGNVQSGSSACSTLLFPVLYAPVRAKTGQALSQNHSLIAVSALLCSILSDIDGEFVQM